MKVYGSIERLVSILFRKDSQAITVRPNQATTYTAARDIQLPPGDAAHVIVSANSTQTLSNKTIAAGSNTITGLADANIASGAAIDASKIADGSVSSTEFQYLANVTSDIQTQINGKEPTITVLPIAKGGTNSGVALNNNRVIQSAAGAIVEAAVITAARALISDANGIPTHSAVTATELGYVSGVTSAIQTQIDGKQPLDADLTALAGVGTTGILVRTGAGTATTRTLVAGTNISITNANGVAGDITINSTATVSSFKATWLAADGATKVVTHSLATTDIMVQVFDISTGETIEVDTEIRTDANTLTLTASEAPAVSWRVLILAL